MRKINQSLQKKFVKAAKEKILTAGAILQPKRYDNQTYEEFVLDGENPITFCLYPVGHHDTCYSVFGRFQTKIPNFTSPSGKYNFHVNKEFPLEKVIEILEVHLKLIKEAMDKI
jgi:hypothetical protein